MKNLMWIAAALIAWKYLAKSNAQPMSNQTQRAGLQESFGNPSAMPSIDRSAMSQG